MHQQRCRRSTFSLTMSEQETAQHPHKKKDYGDDNDNDGNEKKRSNILLWVIGASPLARSSPSPPTHPPTVLQNPFRHRAQFDYISSKNNAIGTCTSRATNQQPARMAVQQRTHFPNFDLAIVLGRSPTTSSSHETLNRSNALSSLAGSDSQASTSSSLDMSIGAWAALNDHLDHFAKYGLDQSRKHNNPNHVLGQGECHNSLRKESQQKAINTAISLRNPLDVAWEGFLNGMNEQSSASPRSSSNTVTTNKTDAPPVPGLIRMKTVVSVSSGDMEGTEAIEVSPEEAAIPAHNTAAVAYTPRTVNHSNADTPQPEDNRSVSSKSTSSYFNSSRAYELRTPERIFRSKSPVGDGAVTLRQVSCSPASLAMLEDSTVASDCVPIGSMAHMFHALGGVSPGLPLGVLHNKTGNSNTTNTNNCNSNSFASFGGADLSRISGIGSPDVSLQQNQHHDFYDPHGLLFEDLSWDDNDKRMHHHQQRDSRFLDVPSPPPPPNQSTSTGLYWFPSQHLRPRQGIEDPRDTSWLSLPAPPVRRSLSPPSSSPKRQQRRPLLRKQHSCQDYQQHRSSTVDDVFSTAAHKAGLAAMTQSQPDNQSPPSSTLMDFFQNCDSPAKTSTASSTFLFTKAAAPGSADITASSSLVDDISAIHNDSSSGTGNRNTSSSSMRRMIGQGASGTLVHFGRMEQEQQEQSNRVDTESTAAAIVTTPSATRSMSSSSSPLPQIHGMQALDRRRYRTVVPSRVFLKKPPYPVARDSFSLDSGDHSGAKGTAPRGLNQEQQQVDFESFLLQESFEAAYQVSLLEESEREELHHHRGSQAEE